MTKTQNHFLIYTLKKLTCEIKINKLMFYEKFMLHLLLIGLLFDHHIYHKYEIHVLKL